MATYGSRGKKLFGDIAVKTSTADGFSSIAIGSGIVITPNSVVGLGGDLFTTYTTGLTALGIKANDFVIMNPQTNLASGLNYNVVGAAAGVKVHWQNGSGTAVTINSTTYDLFVVKRG